MKKILMTVAVGAALLSACGGVDREGTRDELIKQIEAAGGKVDADCVDTVFNKYSDDELKSIDKELSDNPTSPSDQATELLTSLVTCVTPAGG